MINLLTGLIWLQQSGVWIHVLQSEPVGVYNHPHDFANRIMLADSSNNIDKWNQAREEFFKIKRLSL